MNIKLIVFVTSVTNNQKQGEAFTKEFESDFRPVQGDIIHDSGFHSKYHNGYEVVKVTVDYERNECYVSLSPLMLELEDIPFEEYVNHLLANGWRRLSK